MRIATIAHIDRRATALAATVAHVLAAHQAALHYYEPEYDAYIRDLESLEEAMADVASYHDWFVDYDIT